MNFSAQQRPPGGVAWSSAPAPSATPTVSDTVDVRDRRPRRSDTPSVGLASFPVARDGGWWTHGLPPKSGTVTADAAQHIAAIGGTGRHDFRAGWTGTTGATRAVRSRPSALQVAAARAGRSSSTTRSAARPRAWAVGLADHGRPRFDAWLDQPAPRRSAPALAARPGRPRAAPVPRRRAAARPAAVGRRAMAAAPSAPKPERGPPPCGPRRARRRRTASCRSRGTAGRRWSSRGRPKSASLAAAAESAHNVVSWDRGEPQPRRARLGASSPGQEDELCWKTVTAAGCF